MLPTLFSIGTLEIHSNFFFSVLGFLVCLWAGSRLAGRAGYSRKPVLLCFAGLIPSAYLLGMLNAWLFNLPSILRYPSWQKLVLSGWVSYGGILGALLYGLFAPKTSLLDLFKRLDILAVGLPLFEGIYRIGCLLNGCCYGREYTGFGAMYLPDDFHHWALRYPTQLLYILLGFGLFLFLFWQFRRNSHAGRLAALFMILYGIGRLAIDGLRGNVINLGIINLHQAAAILLILLGIAGWILLKKHAKNL
jgi:phosphatidylglycerol:prolipoprotein diacylglycerol transferase